MSLHIVATTKPLALSGTITLGVPELTTASAHSLDAAREQEILDALAALTTPPTVSPAENQLSFSLTQDEILMAFRDIGPDNSDKLWLLVVLFFLEDSPVINDSMRTDAVIDLLTLVKEANATLPKASTSPS